MMSLTFTEHYTQQVQNTRHMQVHMLGQEASLSKYNRMGVTHSMFLGHKRIKFEIRTNKDKPHAQAHIFIGLRIYPEEI